ncbi:amidophosphoribosyltransferase [Geoglobus ahangari]|uniref:Amidophosphoribosyltransferase n=1 Tax=Geoglobus ahangari TaxID=113653 RepID=A0A0F7DBP4_9EURY|nr:amidophosphoribosyltransferase [Geoglobus ahangari]AKG91446.1 amidophosphoribosyltransferase [Geoglobus ahangari]
MCGVVGVFCRDENLTSRLAFFSLYSLQHRGQESAGIAVFGDYIHIHKGMGLVSEVFDEKKLNEMRGNIAVGHVRYSTTGESRIENAQPLLVKTKSGALAIAHNGNLVNYQSLREELENGGAVFITDSDTEVIAKLISKQLLNGDVVSALKSVSQMLSGSYTLVMAINDTLIGYRDPLGFKPLIVGEGDFGYVIASESCAIDAVGARVLRDVEPGEAVVIREGEMEFVRVERSDRKALCVFEYIYFARPDSIIDGISVYDVRQKIGRILARESPVEADMVSPVPDSGTTSAIGFSKESGIEYLEALIKNRYVGRTFILPNQSVRELSVKIKMNAVKSNVDGKRVVLIDDSIVRGTTSRKIVDMVRNAGAKEVHFRVGSPPIISPCYFGIDMSTREELIASSKSVEEIREEINADSLAYLSLDGLVEAVGMKKEDLCLACLTADYPVDVSEAAGCRRC